MKKFKLFVLVVIGFSIWACDAQKENDSEISKTLIDLAPEIDKKGEKIEVQKFNENVKMAQAMRQSWSYSPISVALKLAGEQMDTPAVQVEAKSLTGSELITEARVIVKKEGLLDDSLLSEIYSVKLYLAGSIWQVSTAYKAWNCREGRGHSEFNSSPCE
jgi:hypothetical protein